jgi:hypothetical protein
MRESEYFSSSNEQQFETYEVGHLVCLLMNAHEPTPLYLSPIPSPKNVLDRGTWHGSWAIDNLACSFSTIHDKGCSFGFLDLLYDTIQPKGKADV